MARRVFFSFHYERDIWLASQVRNSWVTKPDREAAEFWDAASWEEVKKKGEEAIKRWIDKQLEGTSVTVVLIGAEIYARMSYNRWFYEFNDDGLKLERGIIWKRYSNVPYQRIQNVDLHRGIIARMFGFTSILIQTAGYSARPYAEGYIPAVDMGQAEKIREFVMKKIKRANRNSGI